MNEPSAKMQQFHEYYVLASQQALLSHKHQMQESHDFLQQEMTKFEDVIKAEKEAYLKDMQQKTDDFK